MTAVRARRTRAAAIGLAGGVLGLAALGGLAYAGVDNVYDSRAGRLIEDDARPAQVLPHTSTALLATVDDAERITSIVVLVLEPDGTGGSIVAVSPSADVTAGLSPQAATLATTYVADGPEAFLGAAEGVTGLSFDLAEVADADRLAGLLGPLGELTARLPSDLRDASSGAEWVAGDLRLSPAGAAEALVASDPGIADWYLDAARDSVWAAVADRVGAGIGSAPELPAAAEPLQLASLDEFLVRLLADRVEFRALGLTPFDAIAVAARLPEPYASVFGEAVPSAITHDRAEVLLVFASVAPARVGAPLEAYTFRLLSRFEPDELEPFGVNNADVASLAIHRLLWFQMNMVSFGLPSETPDRTRIEVANPEQAEAVREFAGDTFGAADIEIATAPIEGIDVQITLGRSFLTTIDAATTDGGDAG